MDVQWPLVFFTLLTGLGIGAFSCVAVTEWLGIAQAIRIPGAVTALAAIAAGSGFSFLHLSHPFRTYHIPRHFGTGVGREMLLTGLTAAFIFIYIIMPAAGLSGFAVKAAALLGLISGVLMAFEMGAIYILPGRPAWNTWVWPFIYAASAAATGLMAMVIWAAAFEDRVGGTAVMGINKAALISLIILGGSLLAYIIFLDKAPYKALERSPGRLLSGDMAFSFWAGVVFAGLAIPIGMVIYIEAAGSAHHSLTAGVLGLLGALIGGTAVRALMYRLGSEVDPMLQ